MHDTQTTYLLSLLVLCPRTLESFASMNMATKLLSLIIAAGMLWTPVRNQLCLKTKCRLRSVLLTALSKPALMKVETAANGNVTGVSFSAKRNKPNYTEFIFKRCRGTSGIVFTMRWNFNRSYILAERSGQLALENSSSTSDAHRFYLGIITNTNYITFKSKTSSKYLMTDDQGVIGLTSSTQNRGTYFVKKNCVPI